MSSLSRLNDFNYEEQTPNAFTQCDLQKEKEVNPDKKYTMMKKNGTWVYLGKIINIYYNQPSYQNDGCSWWSIRFEIIPEQNDYDLLSVNINSSNTHIVEYIDTDKN